VDREGCREAVARLSPSVKSYCAARVDARRAERQTQRDQSQTARQPDSLNQRAGHRKRTPTTDYRHGPPRDGDALAALLTSQQSALRLVYQPASRLAAPPEVAVGSSPGVSDCRRAAARQSEPHIDITITIIITLTISICSEVRFLLSLDCYVELVSVQHPFHSARECFFLDTVPKCRRDDPTVSALRSPEQERERIPRGTSGSALRKQKIVFLRARPRAGVVLLGP
jgi:hypothetical protein